MATDESAMNKAVVRRFFEESWGRGDMSVVDEVVADEVVRNGERLRRDGMVEVIRGIRAAMPDFETRIEDLIGEGNRVASRYSSRGTHSGEPLLGIPMTGSAISYTGTAMWRLEDGKI